MQAFGGLDAVVNLVALAPADVGTAASLDEIERRVAARLLLPCLIAKIAANRMALSYIEGLIINVAMLTPPIKGPAQAFACVAKAALTAMTRAQAEEWSGQGDPVQCHRPADRRPAGGAQPRGRARGRGRSPCSWPPAAARPSRAMCSRPRASGSRGRQVPNGYSTNSTIKPSGPRQ